MADDISDLEAGLLPVEPLPLDETPSNTHDEKKSVSSSGNTSRLGLSQHSPVWWLHRIQKYSSYIFSAFTVAHITNTSILPLITRSVPASETYLLLTRPYYQGIPAEPLLIAVPLCGHIFAGLALRIYRRNQNAKRFGDAYSAENKKSFFTKFWPQVGGVSKSGFVFTPLLLGHIFVNRVIPLQFPGGSSNINLNYVSHALAKHPISGFLGFAALVGVGCFHITWGWAKWLSLTPAQVREHGQKSVLTKKRRWYIINAIAAAVTGLWLAGSLGVIGKGGLAPGWVGKQYDEMYKKIPLIGAWT